MVVERAWLRKWLGLAQRWAQAHAAHTPGAGRQGEDAGRQPVTGSLLRQSLVLAVQATGAAGAWKGCYE